MSSLSSSLKIVVCPLRDELFLIHEYTILLHCLIIAKKLFDANCTDYGNGAKIMFE